VEKSDWSQGQNKDRNEMNPERHAQGGLVDDQTREDGLRCT